MGRPREAGSQGGAGVMGAGGRGVPFGPRKPYNRQPHIRVSDSGELCLSVGLDVLPQLPGEVMPGHPAEGEGGCQGGRLQAGGGGTGLP